MPAELKHYVMGAIIVAVVGVLLLVLFFKLNHEPLTLAAPVVEPVITPGEAEEAVSGTSEDLQAASDELGELDRILE